jgi:hypothetical protein
MTLRVPNDAQSFIALDDWGRNGEYNQHSVAGQMAVAARALDVQFILALGDNFYPSGVRSTADPQWRASFEDVYSAHALNVDWYVVLGNHDYKGNPQAEVDYSRVSRRWRMPARYDSVRQTIRGGGPKGMDGTRFVASRSGFLAMSLMPDSLLVQAVDYTGRLWYRTSIVP